jgi:hypothetical protein
MAQVIPTPMGVTILSPRSPHTMAMQAEITAQERVEALMIQGDMK